MILLRDWALHWGDASPRVPRQRLKHTTKRRRGLCPITCFLDAVKGRRMMLQRFEAGDGTRGRGSIGTSSGRSSIGTSSGRGSIGTSSGRRVLEDRRCVLDGQRVQQQPEHRHEILAHLFEAREACERWTHCPVRGRVPLETFGVAIEALAATIAVDAEPRRTDSEAVRAHAPFPLLCGHDGEGRTLARHVPRQQRLRGAHPPPPRPCAAVNALDAPPHNGWRHVCGGGGCACRF